MCTVCVTLLSSLLKIYDIDPGSESTFPNISQLKEELISDNWIYNKTPAFTVTHKKVRGINVTYFKITTIIFCR